VAQKSVQEYAETVRQLRNQMLLLQESLLHLSEKLTELKETSRIVSRLYTQGPSEN
jgi:prefoldin subunit 5